MTKRWSEKLSSLWVPSEIWFSIYPNPWSNPTVSSSTVRRRRRRPFGEDPSRRATRGRRELLSLQNEKKKMTDHSPEFHPSRDRQRIAIDGEIEERGRKKKKYGFRRKPRRRRESCRIGPIRSSHVGVPTNPKNAKLITGSLLSFYFSFIFGPLFFWNPLLELHILMELLLYYWHGKQIETYFWKIYHQSLVIFYNIMQYNFDKIIIFCDPYIRLIYIAVFRASQCLHCGCGHIVFAIRSCIYWRHHMNNPFSLEMRNQQFQRHLSIHILRKKINTKRKEKPISNCGKICNIRKNAWRLPEKKRNERFNEELFLGSPPKVNL